LCNGSHLGLGAYREFPGVSELLADGLLSETAFGTGPRYLMTDAGKQALASWQADGDPRAVLLAGAPRIAWQVPHWWDQVIEADQVLATLIMRLPVDQHGGARRPEL
jgi:hypothetical protein